MDPTYYCREHAAHLKDGIDVSDLLGTLYQQEKYAKHTTTGAVSRQPTVSVFDSTHTDYYEDCIRETVEHGAVEIDEAGRTNILHCPSAGSDVGTIYNKWGEKAARADMIVVVNTSEGGEIHPMLTHSSNYSSARCHTCEGALF